MTVVNNKQSGPDFYSILNKAMKTLIQDSSFDEAIFISKLREIETIYKKSKDLPSDLVKNGEVDALRILNKLRELFGKELRKVLDALE